MDDTADEGSVAICGWVFQRQIQGEARLDAIPAEHEAGQAGDVGGGSHAEIDLETFFQAAGRYGLGALK